LPKPPIRAGITMQGHITGKTNVWREISQELSVGSGRRWNILQQAKTPCENNMEALELQTAQCVPRPEPRCAITGGNHEGHRPSPACCRQHRLRFGAGRLTLIYAFARALPGPPSIDGTIAVPAGRRSVTNRQRRTLARAQSALDGISWLLDFGNDLDRLSFPRPVAATAAARWGEFAVAALRAELTP
jgi:hypothetical protein